MIRYLIIVTLGHLFMMKFTNSPSFAVTDGNFETEPEKMKISISGEYSGEIHFHTKTIKVREGNGPNM